MQNRKVKLIGLIFICITISAIADNHRIYGSNTQRIALLPFKINAAEDLSFLKDGIYDMFMTRLAKEGQVEVLSRGEVDAAMQSAAPSGTVNEVAARSIGTRLKADFVLFGSLTVLGENVSIEAFSWDGVGLRPNWKTRTMTGYIPDYSVGDFDNDSQDELIAALILKGGEAVSLTEPKSTMIAYELSSHRNDD